MKEYLCKFEVAGATAMFTRPDTGSTPISYPAPTFSAAKGMFEAVARLKSAYIKPTKVEICLPIKYQRYTTNYGGPLRKSASITKRASYQLKATVLIDVCYRIYGVVIPTNEPRPVINDLHACQEIFNRRLSRGQFFYTPCLGWKEFAPSYFGNFREEIEPDTSINLVIPSMVHTVFNDCGEIKPKFVQNVQIKEGVLNYAQ